MKAAILLRTTWENENVSAAWDVKGGKERKCKYNLNAIKHIPQTFSVQVYTRMPIHFVDIRYCQKLGLGQKIF